jgi:hypothetical protein
MSGDDPDWRTPEEREAVVQAQAIHEQARVARGVFAFLRAVTLSASSVTEEVA